MKSTFLACLLLASGISSSAQSHESWISVGPDGGDVRTLSADPANSARILLGTSAGQIYESKDSGRTWHRFVRIGKGNDYVIDHIVFSKQPGVIYVAAWTLEHAGGAVFKSSDDGHTWQPLSAMEGKSVRSIAMARSDPNTLVAGALDGVFETRDGGENWQRISPESSSEIKNIESVAIDPSNPEVIYVGTWHLPWKTTDGGKTWHNIKNGVIDDSDVFSIIIDPTQPQVVYASACSGIYKSETAGELFHKIQGIPFSARRTRVLKQDLNHPAVVYAGTTEGLWKTSDAGGSWHRITSADVIVNDVLIDTRDSSRVLLATDRSGVLASNNAGSTFESSNTGFAHRQVVALTADPENPSTLYAGLINDKQYGGVFQSSDRGRHWQQMSAGLDGRDVFALHKIGTRVFAGTSNGVFEYVSERSSAEGHSAGRWHPADRIVNEHLVLARKATRAHKAVYQKRISTGLLRGRVTDIEALQGRIFVASSQGMFTSSNAGRSWQGGPVLGHGDFVFVRANSKLMAAAGRNFLLASVDSGDKWYEAKLPPVVTSIRDLALEPDGGIWLASREGLYYSQDGGDTWERSPRLPVVDLASAFYDAATKHLFVTSMNSTEIFSTADRGLNWQHGDSGWLLRRVLDDHGHLAASTAFDGVVISAEPVTLAADGASPSSRSQ